jgi:WD40 repeat protein
MRRSSVILIVLSLFLSACGTFEVSLATPAPAIPPGFDLQATAVPKLSLASSSEEIQREMLESATNWLSIWMDGTITQYAPEGSDAPPQVSREQVWIDLSTNRFRILSGPSEGFAETFKVCDGMTILEMDLKTGQSQSYPLPEFAQVKQFVPTLEPGYGYPQPLWGQIGTPLSQLAFPSDFAQNEGTFKPVGTEFVADHETLVVEWTYAQNDSPSWRMWLDSETAVILKMQTFGKGGGETIQSETIVNEVIYDDIFTDSLFRAPSSLPQFGDVTGISSDPTQPVPTISSQVDSLGEVYFYVTDHNYGNETIKLVRLPGSCAAGQSSCPEAEEISPPFGLNFSLTSLIWSRKGDVAAMAYPISEDGNKAGLFLFDPGAQTWDSLTEFNFIDPPLWSPDGNWLAFRVQDGEGSDEIYAIKRDGTQLTNLSANDKLPSDGGPYIMNGWISNNVILRGGNNRMIYLMRAEDGFVRSLFETPSAESDLVPSPDGSFLAYFNILGQKTTLNLVTPDGNTLRELTAFRGASIYPIVWSPDGSQLAFAKTTNDPTIGQDVFLIGRDGRNLQQVYYSRNASIAALAFSTDGQYLLLQDDDAAGRHIFIINLSTFEQHILQAPNLPLDWWWLAPSWRP